MGIGVSYMGNGESRTFELDGVPAVGSIAAAVLGAQPMGDVTRLLPFAQAPLQAPQVPSMADDSDSGKVKLHEGDIPDVLSRKVAPFGSVVAGSAGLCLRGEEGGAPGGTRMYGMKDGANGFFTFAQMDPGSGGVILDGTGDTPDGSMAVLDGKVGATLRVGGRTDIKIEVSEEGDRWLTVKEFYRLAEITPNGRIGRVSKEIERLVTKQPLGGSDGKYGVRLFSVPASNEDSVHPIPDAFAFGAEADLDTYNETTGQFECNYNEGSLVDDPPVKVIMTTPNTAGGS